jgi:hypothetical protein
VEVVEVVEANQIQMDKELLEDQVVVQVLMYFVDQEELVMLEAIHQQKEMMVELVKSLVFLVQQVVVAVTQL